MSDRKQLAIGAGIANALASVGYLSIGMSGWATAHALAAIALFVMAVAYA